MCTFGIKSMSHTIWHFQFRIMTTGCNVILSILYLYLFFPMRKTLFSQETKINPDGVVFKSMKHITEKTEGVHSLKESPGNVQCRWCTAFLFCKGLSRCPKSPTDKWKINAFYSFKVFAYFFKLMPLSFFLP